MVDRSSPDIVELVTDELLAHGEFSSGANNRSNAREAARVVVDMVRSHSSAGIDSPLAVLIKQYAWDLRRNASGGDDYPFEFAKGVSEYLGELIKRAKGNCTCAQAGFPDSCDNCDGVAQTPTWTKRAPLEAAKRLLIGAAVGSCTCNTKSPELFWHDAGCRYVTIMMALENVEMACTPDPAQRTPDREAVARIIDPTARFEDFEGVMWSRFELERRALAYQKADAILAMSMTDRQNMVASDPSPEKIDPKPEPLL